MAEICYGVMSNGKGSTQCQGSSRRARRRRMDIRRFKFVTGVVPSSPLETEESSKRHKIEVHTASLPASRGDDGEDPVVENQYKRIVLKVENGKSENKEIVISSKSLNLMLSPSLLLSPIDLDSYPRYGIASVRGARRHMEDAVAIYPSFCSNDRTELHYFGVYDGHGCSHVAVRCRERLHELVKEELLESKEATIIEASTSEWKNAMERSFRRMDKEVIEWNQGVVVSNCRCEMQTPECGAVGSTAVVAIVTPDKIIVANCGDSRAVLCRNGKPVPLSSDHKPDRPDEWSRIQAAGGRVIYWDIPRVLGVLAMSRAIGDNYLKPYVSCEPEVTVTDRTAEDDCLILASDGLWDVVSNGTACGVARMCLRGKGQSCSLLENEVVLAGAAAATTGCGQISDKACSDASMLLTKLALARQSTDNVSVVVVDLRKDT
ncbi:hypothetical protein MANES_01G168600v8 [Manihot esculenta]|uniref:protein-serine/threonine phosphatase n=1 Tax=Manihot esculenta TaxID=3983 RepID=A0A2C9WNU2_MANES|nr:hypothetical protein MANES_01G168600v8 [Manihot esculenta]